MFLFSVSSFIDLGNAVICALSAYKLWTAYKLNHNELIRYFSYFFSVFSVFFLALGIPFFFPSSPALIQTFFVIAHLLLYSAIAVFLIIFARLLGFPRFAYPVFFSVVALGVIVFILSMAEGKDAVLHTVALGSLTLISWSHGGSTWILLLIGVSGACITFGAGLYFFTKSAQTIQHELQKKKGRLLGIGFMLLGTAAVLAFILKPFSFYNFWVVLAAELCAISGLILVYRALLLKEESS